ncbi:hypothetical protein [Actinocatenispora thailandica]|uniref:hypothetical protein n=1 Tax=Actinocatenispora thailandica TaxID=227318 RepID=UPI00194DD8A8|nr:hypothetical protein [Actinocatenispora thailandica]
MTEVWPRVAMVFGPRFWVPRADRLRRLAPADRRRVSDYLAAGAVVLDSSVRDVDQLDAARGAVLRPVVRTDGTWVWSDRLTYYATEHAVAPEPAFLRWIARPHGDPTADSGTVARVRAALAATPPDPAPVGAGLTYSRAVFRGRVCRSASWAAEPTTAYTRNATALADGFDPTGLPGGEYARLIPRAELDDLYGRVTYVLVRGHRIAVVGQRDGRYLVRAGNDAYPGVVAMRMVDRGDWTGEVPESAVTEVIAEHRHYPVGPGWRDRPSPQRIERIAID